MCGRYTLYDIEEMNDRFDVEVPNNLKPNYNVAPTQTMPVIKLVDEKPVVEMMHWGIPRVIGKDLVKEIINTRSDKALGRFWKKQVTQQKVLIPANGFYEWKKVENGKEPNYIHLPNQELYAFAGIWNSWTDEDGKTFDAYSIMTTEPNNEMKSIHNRMPVILSRENELTWLSADDEELIENLLKPLPDGSLVTTVVSKDVNSVRNNRPELLKPTS